MLPLIHNNKLLYLCCAPQGTLTWGCSTHISNSKLLLGATRLNEIAFAVREATTEIMHDEKHYTFCIAR